jgi:diguanylate cyclase (GGDEF)-like protein
VTAGAQSALVGDHVQSTALTAVVEGDARALAVVLNAFLEPSDLIGGGPVGARKDALQRALGGLLEPDQILALEIRRTNGSALATAGVLVPSGSEPHHNAGFNAAAAGVPSVELLSAPTGGLAGLATTLQEHLPLTDPAGSTVAVLTVWRNPQPLLDDVATARRETVLVTLAAAGVLAVILFGVFRAAQQRISRQTVELLEAERRDALTGLPNHGSIVAALERAIEASVRDPVATPTVEVALVDIDNFRLLNRVHGHPAGDTVLGSVARLLGETFGRASVGRYGPDEFLAVRTAPEPGMADAIEAVRARLADEAIVADGERIPLTLSAATCVVPTDAGSMTEVLAVMAATLGEAKASGGDRCVAASPPGDRQVRVSFDVLQGLVFAIDAKDRYTKRHSEDVAGYGLFLADLLDLADLDREAIRVAGLLHDVGKIGIPDEILRKPGRLTGDEMEIVRQHVRLGDLIVRDLPNLDVVRAGVRHHHERIDGTGYLDRLAGEEIPLIARILAVGDAFSAMTTSRPYRKALSVEEALRRLGDAAGSQLDERLVTAFVAGIESHPGAPLPGRQSGSPDRWAA